MSYTIRFDDEDSRDVVHYVLRGFFSWGELPAALLRLVTTREFWVLIGIPVALLVLAEWLTPWGAVAQGLFVLWLAGCLLKLLRLGRTVGIGCYTPGADGGDVLVGGLRLRVAHRARTVCVAGALVDPHHRGRAICTALLLGALRCAAEQANDEPLHITLFAPAHPASRGIFVRHLGRRRRLRVGPGPEEAFTRCLQSLEEAMERAPFEFRYRLEPSRGRLFR